jgi:hypothetical protein
MTIPACEYRGRGQEGYFCHINPKVIMKKGRFNRRQRQMETKTKYIYCTHKFGVGAQSGIHPH